jgi:hypothetical protein
VNIVKNYTNSSIYTLLASYVNQNDSVLNESVIITVYGQWSEWQASWSYCNATQIVDYQNGTSQTTYYSNVDCDYIVTQNDSSINLESINNQTKLDLARIQKEQEEAIAQLAAQYHTKDQIGSAGGVITLAVVLTLIMFIVLSDVSKLFKSCKHIIRIKNRKIDNSSDLPKKKSSSSSTAENRLHRQMLPNQRAKAAKQQKQVNDNILLANDVINEKDLESLFIKSIIHKRASIVKK